MSFFDTMYFAYAGLPGLLTIVNAINPTEMSKFVGMVIGTVVSIVATIILIQVVGFDETKNNRK